MPRPSKHLELRELLETIQPRHILENRVFEKVALDPPDFEPGSWVGAGNAFFDDESGALWLTARWKRTSEKGFSWDSAVQLLRSSNGGEFQCVTTLHRRDLAELLEDDEVRGVEGQQILRDPKTGKVHLYLAIHREGRGWDTALLTSDHPAGPWQSRGTVIPLGNDYDTLDARDAVISIIDGKYIALYKAASGRRVDGWEGRKAPEKQSGQRPRVNVALATSSDGIEWKKHGLLEINGKPQPDNLLLSGNIVATEAGPLFFGIESRTVIDGTTCGDTFSAYLIDRENMNLSSVFQGRWEPLSPYERVDYPIHSYMDAVVDPFNERLLLFVEAIDPDLSEGIGIDKEVDRLLLYSVAI